MDWEQSFIKRLFALDNQKSDFVEKVLKDEIKDHSSSKTPNNEKHGESRR
jgi:hypothetical protein